MVASVPCQDRNIKKVFRTTQTGILGGRKASPDLRKVALLINERQHVQRLGSQHVKGGLVVLVANACPVDAFPRVLLLLQLENVPDKELLQLLIGKIDAQLLEADEGTEISQCHKTPNKRMCQGITGGLAQKPVVVEVLEAEDVEQADGLLDLILVFVND